jgi:cation transport regulator ChaC
MRSPQLSLTWMLVCAFFLVTGNVALAFQQETKDKKEELDKVDDFFGIPKSDDKASDKKEEKKPEKKKEEKKEKPDEKSDTKKPDEESKDEDEEKAEGDGEAQERILEKGTTIAIDMADVEFAAVAGEAELAQVDAVGNAVKVEKAFLRRACKLTEEQEKTLESFDQKWIKKNVKVPGNQMVNGVMMGFNEGQSSSGAARKAAFKAISKVMVPLLDAEQKTAFDTEVAARDEFERQVRLDALLLLLDEKLYLREEQREELRKVLSKGAVANIDPYNYMMNSNYLPTLPDSAIMKVLDAEQKKVYAAIQKVSFGVSEDLQTVIER